MMEDEDEMFAEFTAGLIRLINQPPVVSTDPVTFTFPNDLRAD